MAAEAAELFQVAGSSDLIFSSARRLPSPSMSKKPPELLAFFFQVVDDFAAFDHGSLSLLAVGVSAA